MNSQLAATASAAQDERGRAIAQQVKALLPQLVALAQAAAQRGEMSVTISSRQWNLGADENTVVEALAQRLSQSPYCFGVLQEHDEAQLARDAAKWVTSKPPRPSMHYNLHISWDVRSP
jgi:hypothetical protein